MVGEKGGGEVGVSLAAVSGDCPRCWRGTAANTAEFGLRVSPFRGRLLPAPGDRAGRRAQLRVLAERTGKPISATVRGAFLVGSHRPVCESGRPDFGRDSRRHYLVQMSRAPSPTCHNSRSCTRHDCTNVPHRTVSVSKRLK